MPRGPQPTNKLKSGRKQHEPGRPKLRVVPDPKPKRRTRPRWLKLRAFGRTRKPKFTPELLAYEEDIVLAALKELGRPVSIVDMERKWPGRFKRKQLWWVLVRLRAQDRIQSGPLPVLRHARGDIYDGRGWSRSPKAWFERHKPRVYERFWL